MSRYADDKKAYAFEACDMRVLVAVRQRLYDDQPLSDNQRRDLANTLDALTHRAVEIDAGQ